MESFDIDLDDLDLKSVDIKPTTPVTTASDFKNVSFGSGSSQNYAIQPSRPNLSVADSSFDASGLSSDKGIDLGLDLLMNPKKIRADVTKLGSASASVPSSPTPKTNIDMGYGNAGGVPEKLNLDDTELLQKSLFDEMLHKKQEP